jgi:hypothetical protein
MKIAIMGSAPSSRKLAPFNDLEWEFWSCSPPNFDLPRVDKWFELHSLERKLKHPQNGPFVQVLQKHPNVYTVEQGHPMLPNSKQFPWQEVMAYHGPYAKYFITSSIAWMLGWAIMQKPKEIGMWGVDMAATSEYAYQRPGLWWFMERADKEGIQIRLPHESDLAAPVPLYGVREQWPQWRKHQARNKELQERLARAEKASEGADHDILLIRGALDDMRYQENTWIQPAPQYAK